MTFTRIIAFACLLGATACGVRGDLYHSEDPHRDKAKPAIESTP